MNTDDHPTDPAESAPPADPAAVERYEIRVSGRLSSRWATWFDGLTLTNEEDGTTVLRGPVVDQAALHGLLQKLRDLGITLLSLTRTAPGEPLEHPISPTNPNRTTTPGASS
ncbi:MAG: hypothetical protein JWO77_3539 [Ilumatobacteraceae bacterium]|nr:hypothetical protein [Ilumatobacteraceae bacterium]